MTFVYFVQAGDRGPIKIGVASNLPKRLAQLQVGHYEQLSIILTIHADYALEAVIHRRFKRGHIRGEWFRRDTPGLLDLVGNCIREDVPEWVTAHIRDEIAEAVR